MSSGKTAQSSGPGSSSMLRRLLHRFVPANFNNIIGLTRRLLFEGKTAGRMAMLYSLGGLLLTPLDLLLQIFEKRLYRNAPQSRLPQLFVCGAPRSGTTVVAQTLIRHLPVYYFNNLTSLFPRSPIMANRLFGRFLQLDQSKIPLDSFYGRTTRLSFPNDALYLWDRWTGTDRKKIPESLSLETQQDIIRFFNAVEAHAGRPLLNKNNSLNTYAALIAAILPDACFICLDRDPLYLAQSHYVARKFIHGDEHISYGIRGNIPAAEDPIEDICRQVLFHKDRIRQQEELIGADRFVILSYEDFCARPAYWVSELSQRLLGHTLDSHRLEQELPPLRAANKRKIEADTFQKIEDTLAGLTVDRTSL